MAPDFRECCRIDHIGVVKCIKFSCYQRGVKVFKASEEFTVINLGVLQGNCI